LAPGWTPLEIHQQAIMKKIKISLMIATVSLFTGCACAPNSWNVTVPTGFEGKPAAQGVWVGVSGPLPWGK